MRVQPIRLIVALSAVFACGGPQLNQTSVTCPTGRTLLDGVCVNEGVADYVACVRAQGASLGGSKRQQLSADVGTVGLRAGGAAEASETMERRYAASDATTLEIVRRCASAAPGATAGSTSNGVSDTASIAGSWGKGGAIIEGTGATFVVKLPNSGRGPFNGKFTGPRKVDVTFYDDPGCCTGTVVDGNEVIRWSNGTAWVRDK